MATVKDLTELTVPDEFVLAPEVSGKAAYKALAHIHVYPVSRGTWTVRAHYKKRIKQFTGLEDHFAVAGAVFAAQDWLDEQAS